MKKASNEKFDAFSLPSVFNKIIQKQFAGCLLIIVHAEDLGMRTDLFHEQFSAFGLPAVSRHAKNKGLSVHNTLKPELTAADAEFGTFKGGKGNFLMKYVEFVVGAIQTIVLDLGYVACKTASLGQNASALAEHHIKNLIRV
jgi:hypothetical protein